MNITLSQAEIFLNKWKNKDLNNSYIKTIFCPSYTELFSISEILQSFPAELGAQNVFYESKGAFTGEISCAMLKEAGCHWVILGHSERRLLMGETDRMINQKLEHIIAYDMFPILCIGETIDERESGYTGKVLTRQLSTALDNIDPSKLNNMVIAYEPVWAIGTGFTANNEIIYEAHSIIKNNLNVNGFNDDDISIVYGGSVSVDNAAMLSGIENVDGFLIGNASLQIEKFYSIYNKL